MFQLLSFIFYTYYTHLQRKTHCYSSNYIMINEYQQLTKILNNTFSDIPLFDVNISTMVIEHVMPLTVYSCCKTYSSNHDGAFMIKFVVVAYNKQQVYDLIDTLFQQKFHNMPINPTGQRWNIINVSMFDDMFDRAKIEQYTSQICIDPSVLFLCFQDCDYGTYFYFSVMNDFDFCDNFDIAYINGYTKNEHREKFIQNYTYSILRYHKHLLCCEDESALIDEDEQTSVVCDLIYEYLF